MQRTRLGLILDAMGQQLSRWASRSWYVHFLRLGALLGGFFSASILITLSGQRGGWDVLESIGVGLLIEGINWLVYRKTSFRGQFALNLGKIGLLYGLAIEGFKLAS